MRQTRLTFLLTSLLLSILVAEGIFYLFHYPSNAYKPEYLPGAVELDPVIGWKHRAGKFSYMNPLSNQPAFDVTILDNGSRLTGNLTNSSQSKLALIGCSFV